jgi:hypothetical protein
MRACDLNLCIDLHRSRQIPTLPASRSCPATPSTNPLNRVGCPRAPHLQRPNPHRARCTTAAHFPRFRPLEVFVRRPPEYVAPLSWAGIRKPSQTATSRFVRAESALASTPDIGEPDCHVSVVPIVLQKSQIDSRRFFREKTKQAAIVDGYGVKFVSEVACEFIAVR